MLWRASLRRLPILILAYAFALQVIVAGWSGAIHGPGFAASAMFDAICRSPIKASSDGVLSSTDPDDPSTPSAHHDCALACVDAQGGAFAMAYAGALAIRHVPVVVARAMDGVAFPHLALSIAAFAARAPPQVI